MKSFFEDYKLMPDEEMLLNLQALEIIKAYDYNNNEKLLDYAMFLLSKIEKYEYIEDIVYINKMQIYKRQNVLDEEMKTKLVDIKERNNELFYKISVDLLIDSKEEAKILFSRLSEKEREIFEKFPIAKYLKE